MSNLITLDDFEEAAAKKLPRMALDYFRSGADEQQTLRANREAFNKFEIWYRVLVDTSTIDSTTTVLGVELPYPILVSPTAYQRLAHRDGEAATAAGAAAAGTIFTLSTLATTSIEEVAVASDGPKWFQLYVHKDRGLSKSLLERAETAGYRAIVLTVDAPILGRRLADERNRFALPEGLSMVNLGDLADDITQQAEGSALTGHVATRHDASFSWNDLEWLRAISSLPLLIKGIVRGDDAKRAAEHGVDGIIVSNHGGRQLDGAPASIEALPEVVEAVSGKCEVLLDGGVRWGTDVLKAIGLGARAVMIGRPVIWGLAIDGAAGVQQVLELLRDEFRTAMALAGCPDMGSITPELIRPA
jgi:4-hydroxymandelate oxidase